MKVAYVTGNARLTFEFESDNDKTLVTQLAHIQEVFEEETCGCCKSDKFRFDVREFDGNHYYKLLCDACGATLEFGQHKTGNTLFVKRFVKDTREPLPNRGWYRYQAGQSEPAAKTPEKSAPPARPAPPVKPASAPSANHTTKGPTTPIPTRNITLPAKEKTLTIDEKHQHAIRGFRAARSEADILTMTTWAGQHDFAAHHHDEQADEYNAALDRLGVTASVHGDIPF
jgi:hypothetical protein